MGYTREQLINMVGINKTNTLFSGVIEKKKSKFGNEKVGNVDSKKEYNRMQELIFFQKIGRIKYLKFQVKFLLQESFEWENKKIREINYIADFVYLKEGDNKLTVEDTKGFKEKTYLLKKKLFLHRYGKTHYFLES